MKRLSPNPQGPNPQGPNPQGPNPQGPNPQGPTPQGPNPQGPTPSFFARRRRIVQGLVAAGASAPVIAACSRSEDAAFTPSVPTTTTGFASDAPATNDEVGRRLDGAIDSRILVLVDLQGGNDGLSTLVPAGSGRYYDLRPDLGVEDPLELDSEVGLHPNLARLHARGVATVEGVGPIDGDLSHFAMANRWERGDVDGQHALRTGFLGRLADTLDDGSPLVGASMGGPTSWLTNATAATLSLGGRGDLWFLQPTDWNEASAFQAGLRRLGEDRQGRAGLISQSHAQLLDLAAALPAESDDEIDWEQSMLSEGGDLGQQLYLAADLIEADLGMRIVYARIGGFDTHDSHQWEHPQLMSQVDAAIDGFLTRMDGAGRADDVLVATTSEFGRRVPENGRGLDHGSASTMLLAGAVPSGRFGEPSPLDDLDDDDNLKVTVPFDRYLGTLAESWLGVEAASILPSEPKTLGIFG